MTSTREHELTTSIFERVAFRKLGGDDYADELKDPRPLFN